MDMEAGMDMHLGLQKGVALLEVGQLRLELLNGCKDLCIALVALALREESGVGRCVCMCMCTCTCMYVHTERSCVRVHARASTQSDAR